MFKNYLKIAVRNLKRHKGYSFINVFGLAIGAACFVLILLFVQDELSYDRYHEKADRIYRAVELIEGAEESSSQPFPVGLTAIGLFVGDVRRSTFDVRRSTLTVFQPIDICQILNPASRLLVLDQMPPAQHRHRYSIDLDLHPLVPCLREIRDTGDGGHDVYASWSNPDLEDEVRAFKIGLVHI